MAFIPEELKNFPAVVVTGCPRSGTKISAQIVAHELGARYHPEQEINGRQWDSLVDLLRLPLYQGGKHVVHAPMLCGCIHYLRLSQPLRGNTAVVWVKRRREDIVASMQRMKMVNMAIFDLRSRHRLFEMPEHLRLDRVDVEQSMGDGTAQMGRKVERRAYRRGALAQWAAACEEDWAKYQKQNMRVKTFEMQYEELTGHPLFVSDRTGWAPQQTKASN